MTDQPPPVLWHITFSNYAEKARWALDYKRIPHERRELRPLLHRIWTRRVGGGSTVPVLVFGDGEVAPDSTSIIAALERRHPEPPLYPEDAADRERALALEAAFSDELGHAMRRLAMDHLRRRPDRLSRMVVPGIDGIAERGLRLATFPLAVALRAYYDVTPETVEQGWRQLEEAIDRFHGALGPSGYLAGGRFSVADLTFASIVGALVRPAALPYKHFPGVPEVRALLDERGVMEWIEDMYARHRGEWVRPAAELS